MKVSVYIAASMDGFIARRDGDIDWLHSPEYMIKGEDYGYEAFMASVDVLVMGRHTFEKVLSFDQWPYQGKRVVVLSGRAVEVPESLSDTVEASSLEPSLLLAELEQQGVSHVYVDGGKTIQGFLQAGLINELIITRVPRLIGEGLPLFGHLDRDISLKHLNTQSWPSGLVQSKYKVMQA